MAEERPFARAAPDATGPYQFRPRQWHSKQSHAAVVYRPAGAAGPAISRLFRDDFRAARLGPTVGGMAFTTSIISHSNTHEVLA